MTQTESPRVDLVASEHVVINHYGDRSGILGAYGPFPTEQAAHDAIEHLADLIENSWEVVPLRRVHTGREPSTSTTRSGAES